MLRAKFQLSNLSGRDVASYRDSLTFLGLAQPLVSCYFAIRRAIGTQLLVNRLFFAPESRSGEKVNLCTEFEHCV